MTFRSRNRVSHAVFVVAGILLSGPSGPRVSNRRPGPPKYHHCGSEEALVDRGDPGGGPATAQRRSMNAIDFRTTIRSSLSNWLTTAQARSRRGRHVTNSRPGASGAIGRWALEATDSSITFDRGANTFRWQKESADVVKPALRSPATEKTSASERVYRLERWTPPKQ